MADKALDGEKIGVLVDRRIEQAVGVSTSKLAKERERVNRYYNSELPARASQGSSSYVSNDVYDSVEALKASLLETFAGGQDIIQFTPQGPEDVEPCMIATEYASYVFFRQNCGYEICHDVIDDGLKARVGVVKIYWDENKAYQDEDFEHLPEEDVHGLAAQEEITELNAEVDPETGGYKGTLTRLKADLSQVVIENIAPEEFGIEPRAKKLKGAFHYHRTLKTLGELKAMGLDIKKLKGKAPDGEDSTDTEVEEHARNIQLDAGTRNDNEVTDEMRPYKVYECYMEMAPDGDRPRLYKIIRCCKVTLDIQEVDRSPFKVFVPLRVGHSFYGQNFAQRVVQTQNARTVLTRGILDHTSITNNPRYTVLQGGLTNPREMLDNRLGGLVNITRPDAVAPLQQAGLNPFVYQTLEMLKASNEETTGVSALSQGLNKDAISKQNSQGMVNDLVNLSQTRQKIVARNFGNFLCEVFIEIYRLVLENENRQSVVELAGRWVDIDPKTWIERKDATVTLHLGQNDSNAEAMKFTSLLTMAAQNPQLSRMVGEQGLYNASVKILKLSGIKNTADYLTPPEKLPPPQPDPIAIAKMQIEKQDSDARMLTAQAAMEKAKVADKNHEMQAMISKMKMDFEHFIKTADSHRKDMDVANRIDVSQRELDIVEKAPETEPAKAIVSPNS
jgi:hypothetical protein